MPNRERHMRRAIDVACRSPRAPFGTILVEMATEEAMIELLPEYGAKREARDANGDSPSVGPVSICGPDRSWPCCHAASTPWAPMPVPASLVIKALPGATAWSGDS